MNSTSKRPKGVKKNDGKDRLSELPDEILVHILSFLPILDAVRTVSLRRFGYLWTSLPSLVFKDSQMVEAKYGPCCDIRLDECLPHFSTFVRNVLILHSRFPIDKFCLSFKYTKFYRGELRPFLNEITTWTTFAIVRQVKELEVIIDTEVRISILPQSVFTSQSLVKLELYNFKIDELSRVHMVSLRILSLTCVTIKKEVFEKIISGSPALQELTLALVRKLKELRFTAPNIEKLCLGSFEGLLDCPNLKILDVDLISETQVVDVSSVREVNVSCCGVFSDIDEYMNLFCNAELFAFAGGLYLPSSEVQKLHFPQTKWKRLHIETLLPADDLLGICRVLSSSPHLEELTVYADSLFDSGDKHDANMLSPELPSCLMQQLKIVTLRGYEIPCHSLLQLTKFLLKSSVTLEKLVILLRKNKSAAEDELTFMKQLVSFPRASTNARVTVDSDMYYR